MQAYPTTLWTLSHRQTVWTWKGFGLIGTSMADIEKARAENKAKV